MFIPFVVKYGGILIFHVLKKSEQKIQVFLTLFIFMLLIKQRLLVIFDMKYKIVIICMVFLINQ